MQASIMGRLAQNITKSRTVNGGRPPTPRVTPLERRSGRSTKYRPLLSAEQGRPIAGCASHEPDAGRNFSSVVLRRGIRNFEINLPHLTQRGLNAPSLSAEQGRQ